MKLFFDTEFTGLHKNTTLISIGVVTENDDLFYAELTDYDTTQVNDWLKENVIDNLLLQTLNDRKRLIIKLKNYRERTKGKVGFAYGDTIQVRKMFTTWLMQLNADKIEWVSDVSHYDFVLLVDLLYGNAMDIPDNHSKCCHDVNQDIANQCIQVTNDMEAFDLSREKLVGYMYIKSIMEAFDLSREKLVGYMYIKSISENIGLENKHNALFDAFVIKRLYETWAPKHVDIGNRGSK